MKGWPYQMGLVPLQRAKKHVLILLSVRTQCEDSCLWARKQFVMMVHEPESWLFTWNTSELSPMASWTLNLWEMNSYNVSYLAYGILFWHPDETKPIFSNVLGKYITSLYPVSAETLVSVLGHLYFGLFNPQFVPSPSIREKTKWISDPQLTGLPKLCQSHQQMELCRQTVLTKNNFI